MSANTAQVDGGVTPVAICLCRVISAVFMHVQKPNGHASSAVKEWLLNVVLTHSRVRLDNTTSHTTEETSRRGVDTKSD